MSENEFLAGQILVSQPKNQVGPFSKSVVLIAEHGLTGAWGVIVNRPSSSVSMKDVMLGYLHSVRLKVEIKFRAYLKLRKDSKRPWSITSF